MISLVLLGLLVGFLSSFSGLGGGFLVVPLLIYLGKKSTLAVGTSLLVVFLVAISSLIAHSRLGNVDFKTGALIALGGVVGAQLGPILLKNVPEIMFKQIFSIILVGIGIWLFFSARKTLG